MVWGMTIPNSFGEFWPIGAYEGRDANWYDRLTEHFKDHAGDELKLLFDDGEGNAGHNYSHFVVRKFRSEMGTRDRPHTPPFTPIEPHELPRFFLTEKVVKEIGSLIALNLGTLAVDSALKSIIERLEPGIHSFFPIEIRMPGSVILDQKYYILVIGRYISSFVGDKSKYGCWKEPGSGLYSHGRDRKSINGLALSKEKFGAAHLWRERGFLTYLTCFSDELVAEIEKQGLRIPKHYRMMEV